MQLCKSEIVESILPSTVVVNIEDFFFFCK